MDVEIESAGQLSDGYLGIYRNQERVIAFCELNKFVIWKEMELVQVIV